MIRLSSPHFLSEVSCIHISAEVTYFKIASVSSWYRHSGTAFKSVTKVSFMVINKQWLSPLVLLPLTGPCGHRPINSTLQFPALWLDKDYKIRSSLHCWAQRFSMVSKECLSNCVCVCVWRWWWWVVCVREILKRSKRLEGVGEVASRPVMPSKQSLNSKPHKKMEWVMWKTTDTSACCLTLLEPLPKLQKIVLHSSVIYYYWVN